MVVSALDQLSVCRHGDRPLLHLHSVVIKQHTALLFIYFGTLLPKQRHLLTFHISGVHTLLVTALITRGVLLLTPRSLLIFVHYGIVALLYFVVCCYRETTPDSYTRLIWCVFYSMCRWEHFNFLLFYKSFSCRSAQSGSLTKVKTDSGIIVQGHLFPSWAVR